MSGMSFSTSTSPRTRLRMRPARLAALAAAAAGLLALSAPATASAAPRIPAAGALLSHVCKVLGSDGTTQAVHCADLISLGRGSAAGQDELYCQNLATHAIVGCLSITESVELAVEAGRAPAAFTRSQDGLCGKTFHAAPCGARRVINRTAATAAGPVRCAVWTVSGDDSKPGRGGGNLPDTIILPSGRGEVGPAIGTPHRLVSSCARSA